MADNSEARDAPAEVAVIISAYNPSRELVKHSKAASSQAAHVLIVDDHSQWFDPELERELGALGAVVLRLQSNRGIAAALNEAATEAKRRWDPEYFLTLDQDSELCDGYVDSALKTIEKARNANIQVGAITPCAYGGQPVLLTTSLSGFKRPFDAWQSGMLVPAKVWESLGGLKAELFIDAVDSDFTLRMRASSYEVLIGEGCEVEHSLGEQRIGQLFGRQRRFTAHSASRVYYMTRNGIYLIRHYWNSAPLWLARKAAHDARNHLTRLALDPERKILLRALAIGLRDGLCGRMGKITSRTLRRLS